MLEKRVVVEFNDYMVDKCMRGYVYSFPDGLSCNQVIDILVDSPEMGYIGIECKSIYEESLTNDKIYFSKISHTSKSGVHQFTKQHSFLDNSGRYGVMAIEFRVMGKIFLLPHRMFYEAVLQDKKYITVSEVMELGFDLESDESLLKFIREECG